MMRARIHEASKLSGKRSQLWIESEEVEERVQGREMNSKLTRKIELVLLSVITNWRWEKKQENLFFIPQAIRMVAIPWKNSPGSYGSWCCGRYFSKKIVSTRKKK